VSGSGDKNEQDMKRQRRMTNTVLIKLVNLQPLTCRSSIFTLVLLVLPSATVGIPPVYNIVNTYLCDILSAGVNATICVKSLYIGSN
jgi:hypothetical protein